MLTSLDETTYGNETAESELRNVRGLLLWALYHHQGGSSVVGQPIRKVLGIGEYDHMTHEQIEEAQIAAGVMMPPNYEELECLRKALDHIARVALGSRSGSKRDAWIAARAKSGLNGDDGWRSSKLPRGYPVEETKP